MRRRMHRSVAVWLLLALAGSGLAATNPAGAQQEPQSVRDYLLSLPVDNVMDPKLADAVSSGDPNRRLGILVQVQDTELRDADMFAIRDMGFAPVIRYQILPMAYTAGTPAMIQELASHPRVRRMELNEDLDLLLDRSTTAIKANEGVWDRYVKEGNRIGLPIDGHGVGIAVIDTGVDALHADLEYGLKTTANYRPVVPAILCTGVTGCEGQSPPGQDPHSPSQGVFFDGDDLWTDAPYTDLDGHGTHVAGIAAGSGASSSNSLGVAVDGSPSATYRRGAAPGAHIVGIGVGVGISMALAFLAFDFLYDQLKNQGNPHNIRVLNNSWGSAPADCSEPADFNWATSLQAQAVMVLAYDMDAYGPNRNQHIVFAAGNCGLAATTRTAPQARIPAVVSVAGTTRNGQGMYASSSRGGPGLRHTYPDVAAPAVGIFSAMAGTANVGNDYIGFTGTSMAAPHVSGTIAMMLQAYPDLGLSGRPDDHTTSSPAQYQDPFLNEMTEAEWILKATASHVNATTPHDPGMAPHLSGTTTSRHDGYGLIDAERAVATALALRELRKTDPDADVADALAVVDDVISDVTETHDKVDTLQTAWSGTITTASHALTPLNGQFHLTVPENFTSLDLDLRWMSPFTRFGIHERAPTPADLRLFLRYTQAGDGELSEWTSLTPIGLPAVDGSKTVTITSGQFPDAVVGDALKPWTIAVGSSPGVKVKLDFEVQATLQHTGNWDVPRVVTQGFTNVVEHWGDWHDADDGVGPNHIASVEGASHAVDMRYYDLGGVSDLHWAKPGGAPQGSSKIDIPARLSANPDHLPTRSVRVGRTAWESWHQPASDGGGGDPDPEDPVLVALVLGGATSGKYSDQATVTAALTFDGVPASGRLIDFSLGSLAQQATTGPDGVATATFDLLLVPATYTLTASFAGTELLDPAGASAPFDVLLKDSALSLSLEPSGTDAILHATLSHADDVDALIAGRDVKFLQGLDEVGTSETGPNGVATFTVTDADPSLGEFKAVFEGDSFYLPSASGDVVFDPNTIAITFVTDPIRNTNVDNVKASGTTKPTSSVEVTFSDGLNSTTRPAEVTELGAWSVTGVDARPLANGPIEVKAVATGPNGVVEATAATTKSTGPLPPLVRVIHDGFGYIGPDSNPAEVKVEVTNNAPQATSEVDVGVTDSEGTEVDLGSHTMTHGQTIQLTFDATNLADGILTATADLGTVSGEGTAMLDRGPPEVTINEGGLRWSLPVGPSSMSFTGTASDELSPIRSVVATLKSGNTVIASRNANRSQYATQTNWSVSFADRFVMPGNYTVEAFAIDEAGNKGPTESISVMIL